ncbi:MAG: UrcA family protein [Gammaproteobacteria bacterium]|nr:UrcA family protein [Gammaproteobacteria bacterium]
MNTRIEPGNVADSQGRKGFRSGRNIAGAAMFITGLALSGFAAASDLPKASVEFERGELASAQGLEDLHQRVMRAADKACRMHGVRGIARVQWERECREEMTRELIAAIDSERLEKLHAHRSGQVSSDAG